MYVAPPDKYRARCFCISEDTYHMFQLCGSLKCFSRCWNRAALWHRVNRSGLSKLGYTQLLKVAADYCWCDGPVPHDRISLPALCFCLPGALQRILCLDLLSQYVFGHYLSVRRGAVLLLSYRRVEIVVLQIQTHHECVHCQIKTSPPCLSGDVACIRCFRSAAAVLHLTFLFPTFLYKMTWVLLL